MCADVPRVLVADDQSDVLESLRLLLRTEGFAVETVTSPAAALASATSREFDAVLIDLNYARDTTSGAEGLDLLSRLVRLDGTLPVVVMTAWGSVDLAVEAMRRGARDFVQKPWENERLLATLRTQVELARALRRGQRLEAENRALRGDGGAELIAAAPAMQPVLELSAKVGPSLANVLITGEHGTGKEVVARRLHALSPRAERPLITVNAGGLAEGLFASELFGHVRGAFTDARSDRIGRFEMADGGTLFLDEIANVPLAQQAKLLRVLETGEVERIGSSRTQRVDVRVISATNAVPSDEVAAGHFREDLLFRLNTVEIHLPPLRERREDIALLVQHFISKYRGRLGKICDGISPPALARFQSYDFPGNVRELENKVHQAMVMAAGPIIEDADVSLPAGRAAGGRVDLARPFRELKQEAIDAFETQYLTELLHEHRGNLAQAARAAGMDRKNLWALVVRHGLDRTRFKKA